jgi:uncharacterized protein (TIGR00730 family)
MRADEERVCFLRLEQRGVAGVFRSGKECGRFLARSGLTLVYGGGNVGLMGLVADAALASGGQVIGVIPHKLIEREVAHLGLSSLLPVHTMHERKHKMAELSDAFIALPGGIGTMEELFEAFTWLQLGFHQKPVGLLNVAGFYDSLLSFLAHMQQQRFLKTQHLQTLFVENEIERLLDRMRTFVPNPVTKWEDKAAVLTSKAELQTRRKDTSPELPLEGTNGVPDGTGAV